MSYTISKKILLVLFFFCCSFHEIDSVCNNSLISTNNSLEISEKDVFNVLDNSNDGYFCQFVSLDDPYSYLIDVRLNVFRDEKNRWAIAIERLGYDPRQGTIALQIFYYGNCLMNLEEIDGRKSNNYYVFPIDSNSISDISDNEYLKKDSKFATVRGKTILLSHNKKEYIKAGIKLKEYPKRGIRLEELGRLLVTKHRDLFRATDEELYKSIPKDLKKILVLDEWYHKDFYFRPIPSISDEQLIQTYEFNKRLTGGMGGVTLEQFLELYRQQQNLVEESNQVQWENNRPSSYETWQLLAKVISLNDPAQFKPTLKPNTFWSNHPQSGSL